MVLTRILVDPGKILFCHNSRKYFFEKLRTGYTPELEIGCYSGWMHINGIDILYRTKNILGDFFFEKIFFSMIF